MLLFVRRTKREVVLEKSRKLRLSCTNFDVSSSAPVFINEHLCPDPERNSFPEVIFLTS